MSQFSLENEVNNLVRMDAPLTKGPQMRWQCQANDSETTTTSVNSSLNASSILKTPMKNTNRSFGPVKTPNSNLSKSTGKNKASGHKTPKTPTNCGDRFIANRCATNFEVGYFKIMNEHNEENEDVSLAQREYQKLMSDNLNGDILQDRIISYKNKAPAAPEGFHNNLKVLYSSCSKIASSSKKATRHIPQLPERILDAPEILDDYYLNLLDWSFVHNYLAVSLANSVYLWNAENGEITQLLQLEHPDEYVCSVSWIKQGNYLAVGTSGGEVQLWDVTQQKRLRNMTGHSSRVGSLSWNSYILSSGSRSSQIHHHDVRAASHLTATLSGHSQEVCGLRWSPDGKYLASGGNDNVLNIWSAQFGAETQPLHVLTQHQAAVKALAWCPWQPSLLASGGGTADRNIRFWNCNNGTCLNSVDTKSQVCSILWSQEYKELISGHGFAKNQLSIWKYPSMTKVTDLTGHTARVLHMAMSPDGSTVVSAGADETLRIWKCFAIDELKKKSQKSASKCDSSLKRMEMIR